jgi:hypothetical protein
LWVCSPTHSFGFVLIDWCDCFCREDFRKDYKEKHPNVKQVSVVSVSFSANSSFDSKTCDGL